MTHGHTQSIQRPGERQVILKQNYSLSIRPDYSHSKHTIPVPDPDTKGDQLLKHSVQEGIIGLGWAC